MVSFYDLIFTKALYMSMDNDEDYMGLEAARINYATFYNKFVVRRPTQAGTKYDKYSDLQLPNGSILHSLDGFDTLIANHDGLPDIDSPLIKNERNPIYLLLANQFSDKDSKPFGVDEPHIYRSGKMSATISHFYQQHRKYHQIRSTRTLGTMSSVLTWVDYSPLNMSQVNGSIHNYRKFDMLFRTILNTVSMIGDAQHQYILLPQGNKVYPRSILQRTFKDLSTATLSSLNKDPSIFPILHLLGYIYGYDHEMDVKPYKEDIRIYGKDSTLFQNMRSTSLIERLDPNILKAINFILYRGDRAVVYNLGDIATFMQTPSFYTKFYRHMMGLRLSVSSIPDHIDIDSDHFDTFIDKMADPEDRDDTVKVESEDSINAPKIESVITKHIDTTVPKSTKPILHDEVVEHSVTHPVTFESRVRSKVTNTVPEHIVDTDKYLSKRDELLERHLNVTLSGKSLAEHVGSIPDSKIPPKDLSFISSTIEPGYLSSSIVNLDEHYQQHVYKHELAKVITSVAKHGFYASKIEETKTHTEMDRTTTYKVFLNDAEGKAHHIKFTLPDVDKNGLMKLGGNEYRLTRQMCNIPICKTSPTRVNLSSYYNKVIIERIQSKRFSYENDIFKLIMNLRALGLVKFNTGSSVSSNTKLPYDYSAIASKFHEIEFGNYTFKFSTHPTPIHELTEDEQARVSKLEAKYGLYVGHTLEQGLLFWDKANQIHVVSQKGDLTSFGSFTKLLVDVLGNDALPPKTSLEWSQAHILNQVIPVVFLLGYELGLKTVFDIIKLEYKFYPDKDKPIVGIDDIVIKFSDGTLVFNRYPISRSLLASGLAWVDLSHTPFSDMSLPVTYVNILAQKGMRVGVLKGLRGFIDFFVDPKTESVLETLHEPITWHELLLKANLMLSDYSNQESSSVALHRFRLYERFSGAVYNEIYKTLANHRDNPSTKKAFSINPEAVFQSIVQDATTSTNDSINPIHEVKQQANFTFTGSGGRSGNSFVLKDRIYPKDGLGVISDTVPDSGKVGITAYLSASPNIDDIHGLAKPYKEGDVLDASQILSIGAMVMPASPTDDGKRTNYTSIQLSHYVPNHNDGETLAVRTGYEAVLPHMVSDLFAIVAEDNGTVISVDDKNKVLKVKYADKPVVTKHDLKVPYQDSFIDNLKTSHDALGFLVAEDKISEYPIGGVFSLTKASNGRIIDRLRCDTLEAIPDKDIGRKQNNLIMDFSKGKVKYLYYIRFSIEPKYTHGDIKSYSYADGYGNISGAYLLQKKEANVTLNDKVKKGDILVYNSGFFVPDPFSKQVTLKHGVIATVALLDKGSNHEDACEISRDLANRLEMVPCHQREIVTKKDAAILGMVRIGDHVETTDPLCIISDEYLVQDTGSLDVENLDLMEKLNRQTPQADYSGYIRKIRILYGCKKEELSDSLKSILKVYEKEVRQSFNALNNDPSAKPMENPGFIAEGTMYHGVKFDDNTVVLEFMIEEKLNMDPGDKLVVSAQLKSIISQVNEKQHFTESGIPVDMLFSTTGVLARIVTSCFSVGIVERLMEKLKSDAIDKYFNK